MGINGRLVGVGTRGDPAIQDKVERAALGARLGRYVADELSIGGEALALAALMLIPPVFASAAGETKLTTRRTVAKYRLLLGIPGAFERKQ